MMQGAGVYGRIVRGLAMAGAVVGLALAPASAQVQTVDPDTVIDADLNGPPPPPPPPPAADDPAIFDETVPPPPPAETAPVQAENQTYGTFDAKEAARQEVGYKEDDLVGAAEGVFGKGAEGLADIIRKTLKDQGEPVAYIAGREVSGAIGVGLRYGSGTMFHKVEGERPVYWTGPSIGFDLGGNAGKTFVLVYNLYDSQELYHRYPAGEGAAYFIGGFNASYLRWGNVVLIPIRLGVGYRLGANVGYMKFSEKRRWLPF